MTVTFGAGVTYTMLLQALVKEQVALPNLPSLPHLNVVGSVVTGTHGGGLNNQQAANWVVSMKMVDPDGEVRVVDQNTPEFKRYLHSFNLLGVITEMTMKVEPEYAVIKCIYKDLPWDFLNNESLYKEVMYSHDFISFFTDWKRPRMTSAWLGTKVDMDYYREHKDENPCKSFYGAHLVDRIHPSDYNPEACVWTGVGMWNEKIYHFLPDQEPSSAGNEIQTEVFVSYEDFPEAAGRIYALQPVLEDALQITEIRAVKADDIPLSPAYKKDVVGIHFTWKPDQDKINFPLILIQNTLERYKYRVHYGKMFFETHNLLSEYWPDFLKL